MEQSDKAEEKPEENSSTAEVSNSPARHISITSTPNMLLCPEDRSSREMMLRQRRRPQKSAGSDSITSSTTNQQQQPLLIRAEELLTKTVPSQQQRPKYPRVSASYPRIIPNVRNRAPAKEEALAKPKKALVPPPSCRPPVFLKCTSKRQDVQSEPVDGEDDNDASNQVTTDLDIQFKQMKLDGSNPTRQNEEKPRSDEKNKGQPRGQSLLQYCNFDEKKVVKVAPHIRRKDVICDTVDAWSRQGDAPTNLQLESSGIGRPRYRPLIFGGTYPIDAPFAASEGAVLATAEQEDHLGLSVRHSPKTFNIDAPISSLEE